MPKKGYKHSEETKRKIGESIKRISPIRKRGLKKYGKRKCHDCKKVYPLNKNYFYYSSTIGFSGFGWVCKKCKKVRNKEYNKNHNLKTRFEIFKQDNFTCQYCGRKAPEAELQIDHIIPKSKGGKDIKSNYITSCRECNLGKRDKLL